MIVMYQLLQFFFCYFFNIGVKLKTFKNLIKIVMNMKMSPT